MRALLVGLFPSWWRRRHGPAYRAMLDSAPLTLPILIGVVRAAGRAWVDPRQGRLTMRVAVELTMLTLAAMICFLAGWTSLYKQTGTDVDWRLVQAAAMAYAVTGAVLVARGHRFVGRVTLVLAATAFVWQMSIGVPGWRSSMGPLQVCIIWFMALSCWCAWWAAYGVHDPRRRPRQAG